jgi:hypothetical protein
MSGLQALPGGCRHGETICDSGFYGGRSHAVTLLIISHPHPQAQENSATPDADKLAAAHSGPATGNVAALLPRRPTGPSRTSTRFETMSGAGLSATGAI